MNDFRKRKIVLLAYEFINAGELLFNSTFAIGGVSFPLDSFEVANNFVLHINISGKNPAHRKSAKR